MILDLPNDPKTEDPTLRLIAAALLGSHSPEGASPLTHFAGPQALLRAGQYQAAVAAIYMIPPGTISLGERQAAVAITRDDLGVEEYLLPDGPSLMISMGLVAVVLASQRNIHRWLREGLIDLSGFSGDIRPSRSVERIVRDATPLHSPLEIKLRRL